MKFHPARFGRHVTIGGGGFLLLAMSVVRLTGAPQVQPANLAGQYEKEVRPLLKQFCLSCHSTKAQKGDLDLEKFASLDQVRKDVKPWQAAVEMLENGEMPPKKSPQPSVQQRQKVVTWVRGMLQAEARTRAGDPGRVVLRRLSNAEYNYTIRDLTGLDLQPARDFPADGAAGEGFTNAGDALVVSPAFLSKYLAAAKEVAAHAVLLPDGLRFSPSKTRRDWTDEAVTSIRQFYAQTTSDGRLPLTPYLVALFRHREKLKSGVITLDEIARQERLSPKYMSALWHALNNTRSFPLDQLGARFRAAKPLDLNGLVAEITSWQGLLWRYVPIGSYRYGNLVRQLPNDPDITATQTLRLAIKPPATQHEVTLYLAARDIPGLGKHGNIVWRRPRFEATNKPPLLLSDYLQYRWDYEVDFRSVYGDAARYLAAVAAAAHDRKQTATSLAKANGLDAAWLARWMEFLQIEPYGGEPKLPGRPVQLSPLKLLDAKMPPNVGKPAIKGWSPKGADLPIVVANSSDKTEQIPGRIAARGIAVHPTPSQFVGVVWRSPISGRLDISAKIAHAHPACGNGVAWWLEHRRGARAAVLVDGKLDLGKEAQPEPQTLQVAPDDLILLAVDARDGNHYCDLTEVGLKIVERDGQRREWSLARDIAGAILEGNPHADRFGNKETWRFVRGPARKSSDFGAERASIPNSSVLGEWRAAAGDPKRQGELARLAASVQALLTGDRPNAETRDADRLVYDRLHSLESPLFAGIDVRRLARLRVREKNERSRFGLDPSRFTVTPHGNSTAKDSLATPITSAIEIRLPAALVREREFVVEVVPDSAETDWALQAKVLTAPPTAETFADAKSSLVIGRKKATREQTLQGFADFRRVFPAFICYQRVIPDDEVVCLKLYHREDEPLLRLFLDEPAAKQIDRLWSELRFIARWPAVENDQLPQFIGYVTQDQPKELLAYFESQREPFRKRAEAFEKEVDAAIPRQLDALLAFAARAYRRPLEEKEKAELLALYHALRKKDMAHDEAHGSVLSRVLVSPSFLFRIERSAPGTQSQPVSDWELATRLSYFLWASIPDEELSRLAGEGRLHDPKVIAGQVTRMLKDPKARGLAIEFGAQWLHARDIRDNREKNEKLFPTFNAELRDALFEETVQFFQHFFKNDRPVTDLIDADYTFVNDTLAKHYGISSVLSSKWRQLSGAKEFGRGGVLTQASVLAKQAGASRTSPVLRGNWLVEVMLGEKLPKPPANVPRLPEEETAGDLSVRQMVEKHAGIAECAVCHQRIDPFGFALEKYDPIGRCRDKDLAGRPVDARAKLRDGTEFEGIDGLRRYLLTKRRADFERHFCQKLLGYALGRSVTLSDQVLLDEMLEALRKNEYRITAAVQTIALSKQFRYHRGLDATKDE